MFSTFTGTSRRPRNINLSGQAGNPFSNTSWSPSVVSNTTKTVIDAHADREKRLAERRRLKAVVKIQSFWRGYQERKAVSERQRSDFDDILIRNSSQWLPTAFKLLLAFFSPRNSNDVQRAVQFAHNVGSVPLDEITAGHLQLYRLQRFLIILVQSLDASASAQNCPDSSDVLLGLIMNVAFKVPSAILRVLDEYYKALGLLCHTRASHPRGNAMVAAFHMPLNVAPDADASIYKAIAFQFLTRADIFLFHENISLFASQIQLEKLSQAVQDGYSASSKFPASANGLLWLLAHFINLGHYCRNSQERIIYTSILTAQLSTFSSEIKLRLEIASTKPEAHKDRDEESLIQPLPSYISHQLLALVDRGGIGELLSVFSKTLMESSLHHLQGVSAFASYILTLLDCFPSHADATRMRLFLGEIPTASGSVPTVQSLWQVAKQTTVFAACKAGPDQALTTLQGYLAGYAVESSDSLQEYDWCIILLFLELYIFVLRLSDDEDFLSGMRSLKTGSNSSNLHLRSCSLSLADIEALIIFLKNTAFTLRYRANDFMRVSNSMGPTKHMRGSIYSELVDTSAQASIFPKMPTKLDLESLRAILTTAFKMLYERNSRIRFLSQDYWLMTADMDEQEFINAVMAEGVRLGQEHADDATDDNSDGSEEEEPVAQDYHSIAVQRVSRNARLERLRSEQIRAQRERKLAELGPKLEVLKHIPFVVPFETRVKMFREFIDRDRRERTTDRNIFFEMNLRRRRAEIRRGHIFDDAFFQLYEKGDEIKDALSITFVDQFGSPEAGIDGGGVSKEFLTSMVAEVFGDVDNHKALFVCNEQGLWYPNPTAADIVREELRQQGLTEYDMEWNTAMTNFTRRYEFMGRILAKCLYEGVLVDLVFAGFFLLKWSSGGSGQENAYKGSLNDMRDMDQELYRGMLQLKNYDGDVSELDLDFTIEDHVNIPGQPVKALTRNLIPGGDKTAVTNDNRLLYVSYTARHRLVVQPMLQTNAFLRGLRSIIRPSWISMFDQLDLQRLVGGDSEDIDIDDLRRNTVYSGVYSIGDDGEEHPTIQLFWRVVQDFNDDQRRAVVKYVSSTPRAPLLGFSQLRPKFAIRDGGSDETRLPSASTCANLLKLPVYKTEQVMRNKLLYAINANAGFDLS
ncbi:hypothetical protein CDD81_3377 [Ophiocordyceps australis]|uniref:HECT-type E3 ubiquitin transferase n=1 Tax=Ophiocordyceps australis TaxID=1399860 RepID=A0A2C5XS91_9HYPO|nr:hypothetical protein CDD81_3377 [Ophiocordyceps australis]